MSPLRPPRPPSVRDKSRRRAACSRRQGSSAAAALRRVRRRRPPGGSESHVGQQPLGAGTGPARMPRPLCEARGSPTRPGPAAPGRAEPRRRLSRAGFRGSPAGRAQRLALTRTPRSSPGLGARRPRRVPFSRRASFFLLFPSPSVKPRFPRVVRGAAPASLRGARWPRAFPRLPSSVSPSLPFPDASPQACAFIPFSGPALIGVSFSISSSDDPLLGDVSFARRDQKVKETKVSPAPPVATGREGGPEWWGRGLREAPRGEDLSEAA